MVLLNKFWRVQDKQNGVTAFCTEQTSLQGPMSPEMHEGISVAVKTVNYTKKNALHSRCFADVWQA